ncbi:MAG: hypothetical protein K0S76_763 [Herbinix sp.]|nr:hypothetical protein [Herbinix sp.]
MHLRVIYEKNCIGADVKCRERGFILKREKEIEISRASPVSGDKKMNQSK